MPEPTPVRTLAEQLEVRPANLGKVAAYRARMEKDIQTVAEVSASNSGNSASTRESGARMDHE